MPRAKNKPQAQTKKPEIDYGKYYLPSDARWGGFINVKLDEEQREQFIAWLESTPSEGWRMLEDLTGDGMKCSVAYDAANECFTCSLTGRLVSNSNERYCITSRAGTLFDVVSLAVWKFVILLEGTCDNMLSNGRDVNWG